MKKSNTKKQADNQPIFCSLPKVKVRVFDDSVSPFREALIIAHGKKWANGTPLRYYFFNKKSDGEFILYNDGTREWKRWSGTKQEKDTVIRAFDTWKALGIGLEFIQVNNREDADIRIGFMREDGHWSYVGRDIWNIGINERTMNFDRGIANDLDTALHEIGHTLGFQHEHQNPNAGIEWNEQAVYAALAGHPNYWKKEKTYNNIIRKINPDTVQGSSWDPDSIMHYPFGAGLIDKPEEFRNGLHPAPGLSPRDIEWVRRFYPPIDPDKIPELKVAKSVEIKLKNGEQQNFIFKPDSSRKYQIKTFGEMDAVMVLFQKAKDGTLTYLSADDDSGEDANANIDFTLLKGQEYMICLRQYYNAGNPSPIMII